MVGNPENGVRLRLSWVDAGALERNFILLVVVGSGARGHAAHEDGYGILREVGTGVSVSGEGCG